MPGPISRSTRAPRAPSAQDAPRERLAAAGELLGIPVLDHVVVAEQGYVSLREDGGFEPPGAPKGLPLSGR